MSATTQQPMHIGRKIERIRILRGIKQETLAASLGITQQAVSKLEASEQVDDERLEKVAQALSVPVDVIKNFDEEKAVYNIQHNYEGATVNQSPNYQYNYQPNFNPIDKVVELYERMLKIEQEKNALLETMLKEKR